MTATTTRHIYVIAETPGALGFTLVHDYDLTPFLTTGERIVSGLPDEHGLLWFVAQQDGVVGTLNLQTGAVRVVRLGRGTEGEITKSLGTDVRGGVYIDTNRRLYRFTTGRSGAPTVSRQIAYPNSFEHKPGQLDDGTGTTPVISGAYVAINDNADPMDVMIYRTAVHPTRVVRIHGHRRKADGARVRAVDVNPNGIGCRLVWTNRTERAPTVVSQLSLSSGLIYAYTKDPGSGDPWYWTAIDFHSGRTVYKVLAGTGSLGYNNNYAGIAIASTGTAYLGVLGGIVAMRDGG